MMKQINTKKTIRHTLGSDVSRLAEDEEDFLEGTEEDHYQDNEFTAEDDNYNDELNDEDYDDEDEDDEDEDDEYEDDHEEENMND